MEEESNEEANVIEKFENEPLGNNKNVENLEQKVHELDTKLKQVREEQRPFVFVHNSYRLGPHSKGDDNRTADEIESWKWKDPIPIIEESLTDEEIQVTRNRVCLQIEKITLESKSEKFAKLDIRKLLKGSLWKEDMFNL